MTTQWHPAIASVVANHYIESEQFQREQVKALADVIAEIIDIVELPRGGPYDRGCFQSFYSVSNLLDRIRELAATSTEQRESPK